MLMQRCSVQVGRRLLASVVLLLPLLVIGGAKAQALDRLCDPSNEDCRAILLSHIRAETVGIDVGFWFMEDARYTTELIKKHQAGVPVRVVMDVRANKSNQYNAARLAELETAGIPMRTRTASGIMHYKMMLFAGQGVVEFSGANFSSDAWVYDTPYVNYVDESAYFTDNPSFVKSFMRKYDEIWTATTGYANYANIAALASRYPDLAAFPFDPQLNFPPFQPYAKRAVSAYNKEEQRIDVIMYRITDRKHSDAMLAAVARGKPVRLISDPQQYRDATRLWDAWNIDRMYAGGVQIKMRAHAGLNHQKLVLLYQQGMSIFGSSNWTGPSDNAQEEHNCFCTDPATFGWLTNLFERKWNNTNPVENVEFVPLPPDRPLIKAPADLASNLPSAGVTLKWFGGPWAHRYDVYLGADRFNLQPAMLDRELGPSELLTTVQSFTTGPLQPGTTYYWRVVSRTMAGQIKTGDVWSFTTEGDAPAPTVNASTGAGDIVMYGGDGLLSGAAWKLVSDATAAGGSRLWNPNFASPKITVAAAAPSSSVDYVFQAVAGKPYRLWMRMRAEGDSYSNDSVFVQFSGAVTSTGAPLYQTGSTAAAEVSLEDCGGCGVAGWGWQDNGYGRNVFGPVIYFATSGPQTLRLQQREDGLSVDQIVLSPEMYLSKSPGALKQDGTILPRQDGSGLGTTAPVSAGTTTALPDTWSHLDVGAVGITGNATFDAASGVYTVKGAGADVWGTADALHYAYTPFTGNGTVTARVTMISSTASWVKAGVMIRGGLEANAAQGFMLVSYSRGLAFQRRTAAGGVSTSTSGSSSAAPYWVKIERNGDNLTASQSLDGNTWSIVGTDTIPMGLTIYVGLGVSSHTTSSTATATFDNVSIVAASGSEG